MQNLIRILLLICSLWPFTTSSQPILQIKAGVNRSSMDWDFKDYRWGLHAGSAARFDLSQGFYLQPEILFSIKGSKVQEDIFVIPGYEIEYIFEYLTVPVIAGIRLGNVASLQVGPEINFLLGGSLNTSGSPDRLENFHPDTDFGILGGLVFHLGNKWEIGLRYEYGLTDIRNVTLVDENGQSVGQIPGGNNRNLQLSIGLILGTN